MGDQHQGGAMLAVEGEQQVGDGLAGGLVEVAGWLVGKQQLRAMDEGTRQRHTLLLAAGQLVRVVLHAFAKTDLGQHSAGAFARVGLALQLQRQHDVVQRRQRRQQVEALEYEADRAAAQLRTRFFIQLLKMVAVKDDAAAGGCIQSGEQPEQGGLARAGGADNGQAGAARHLQVDAVEDDQCAIRASHGFVNLRGLQYVTGVAAHMRVRVLSLLMLLWLALLPAVQAASASLLVLGDSLSAAHGIATHEGWVHLLQQRLQDTSPGLVVVNASISGETTAGGLARLPGLLASHEPCVLAIELGANDGLRGLPLAQIRDNVAQMIALGGAAGAQVVLLGIELPVNYGPRYRGGLRDIYAGLADEHDLPLVPFLLEPVALEPEMMQYDGLHPTAAAQPQISAHVWPVLWPLLEGCGAPQTTHNGED